MDPIEWLCQNAIGFRELSDDERAAIMHFSLLWSFFEAKALGTNANASRIVELVSKWANERRLTIEAFNPSLSYFRKRYFNDGRLTHPFQGLNFKKRDRAELVESVLSGENNDYTDCVAATLIIVYRLRNNLFHGIKLGVRHTRTT